MTNRRRKFKNYVDEEGKRKNETKSRARAKVEHPFRILKRVFGFIKVRYRGLKKNHERLCAAFALVNLYQHRNRLALKGRSVSEGRKTAFRDHENKLAGGQFKRFLMETVGNQPRPLGRQETRSLRTGSLRIRSE
jgi:hypothetical protein